MIEKPSHSTENKLELITFLIPHLLPVLNYQLQAENLLSRLKAFSYYWDSLNMELND